MAIRPAGLGAGACTAITLTIYAEKKGWPMEGLEVRLEYLAERPAAHRARLRGPGN